LNHNDPVVTFDPVGAKSAINTGVVVPPPPPPEELIVTDPDPPVGDIVMFVPAMICVTPPFNANDAVVALELLTAFKT
jgi:hypothetical protein